MKIYYQHPRLGLAIVCLFGKGDTFTCFIREIPECRALLESRLAGIWQPQRIFVTYEDCGVAIPETDEEQDQFIFASICEDRRKISCILHRLQQRLSKQGKPSPGTDACGQ